ncbi:MAG: SAM-dependent methyltransferase [Opitutales bacterium]|nr:SAM-dependent methyltransferase [Opitutales bacterium]
MTKEQVTIYDTIQQELKGRRAIPMDEFFNIALYHPSFGYYSQTRDRVGKGNNTDFYTSNTFGSLWGEMIVDACKKIISDQEIEKYTFIEIAAEPGCSILENVEHPFSSSIIYRLGDIIEIPSPAIVFSNEWLDAQPFKRFRYYTSEKRWREIGVQLLDGELSEFIFPEDLNLDFLANSTNEYTVDWPTGAHYSLDKIVSSSWNGLFITFDYGLSKECIMYDRPEGTARAYYKHKMNRNLFCRPGDQDLTCHLCWDELIKLLTQNKFENVSLESQESFFMHHSQNKIKSLLEKTDHSINKEVQKLKELIHPQHFGSKFQALWGIRK